MSLGESFRRVASLIDHLEAAGVDVEAAERTNTDGDDVCVDLSVTVPADAELRTADGGADTYADASSAPPEAPTPSPTASEEHPDGSDASDATGTSSETVGESPAHRCPAVNCDRAFGTEHGMKIHYGRVHDAEEADDEGADDEGEERAEDAPDQTTVEGFQVDSIRAAVEGSDTLREVALALDVDREEASTLLDELDLLDLVHGRVATKRERDERKREIDDRIAESAATSD